MQTNFFLTDKEMVFFFMLQWKFRLTSESQQHAKIQLSTKLKVNHQHNCIFSAVWTNGAIGYFFLFSRLGVVSDYASSHFFKECVKVPFMHLKAYLRNACRYYLRIFTFHYRLRKDIIYESLCSFTEFYPSLRSFTECVKILFTHLYASLRNV